MGTQDLRCFLPLLAGAADSSAGVSVDLLGVLPFLEGAPLFFFLQGPLVDFNFLPFPSLLPDFLGVLLPLELLDFLLLPDFGSKFKSLSKALHGINSYPHEGSNWI